MATEILRPNGDGYVDGGWSRSTGSYFYACVDEAVKDEADYISSSETYNPECYLNLSAPSAVQPGDSINSITIHVIAKYVTGNLGILLGYGTGDEQTDTGTSKSLTSSYAEYTQQFTGITYSDLADLQMILMAGNGDSGTVRVCQAWVVVEYNLGCPKQMMYRMQVMST